jgi:hypothetical protein
VTLRAAAALLCAAAVVGCGGSSADEDRPRQGPRSAGVRPEVRGTTAGLANCGEWRAATPAQRRATVEDLRDQLTEQADPRARSVLSDERAYQALQRGCREDYASGLRLYNLYVRAAAYEPLRR